MVPRSAPIRSAFVAVARIAMLFLPLSGCFAMAAVRVVNDGIGGQNTAEIDARIEADLGRYAPQVVVLFAGMNDAVNDRKFLNPEETRSHVSSIVRRSQAAGAEVVLVTVHEPDAVRLLQRHRPEVYGGISPEQRVMAVNRVLRAVARKDRVRLIDFHKAMAKAGGANDALSTDGVHLTAQGYGLLAKTIYKGLLTTREDATILCVGDSLTYGTGVRAAGGEGPSTYPAQMQRMFR